MKIFSFLVFSFIIALTVGCQNPDEVLWEITVGTKQIFVEIADNPEARRRGLMFRESLPEDQGMLFVFPDNQILQFWMKDTLIPLSIAYIDEDLSIRSIKNLYPHELNPVSSDVPVMYALEVNQNFFSRNNIRVGDSISLPKPFR